MHANDPELHDASELKSELELEVDSQHFILSLSICSQLFIVQQDLDRLILFTV